MELLTKKVNKCIMRINIWIKGDKMSTIVLYKDRLNGINTYINDVTNSCDSLSTQLNSLKSILQGVSSNSCNLQDTVNNISSSTKTEKDKGFKETQQKSWWVYFCYSKER